VIAAPIPRPPPVMSARLPASRGPAFMRIPQSDDLLRLSRYAGVRH
jgi:hypothetical protein